LLRVATVFGLLLLGPVLRAALDPTTGPAVANGNVADAPPPVVASPNTDTTTKSWPDRDQLVRENGWPPSSSGTGWMWRYLLSLLVVGGLMAAAFVGLRRMRGMLGGSTVDGQLRVLCRVGLDRQNSVFLLKTPNEVLTVTSGPNGVRVLARAGADATEEAAPPAATFQDILHANVQEERSE
jgi:hypothetical protein